MSDAISILPPEMRGVMFITGYRGIGKSFLASQADAPERIAFFDFEKKGEGINTMLNFRTYRALTQESATREPAYLYDIAMRAFRELPENQCTVAVLDNVSPLELSMNAEGKRHSQRYADEFGLNRKNIDAGRFGGTKAIVNFMISSHICDVLHSRGIQLVIATSHIGGRWGLSGMIPNKYRVKGADRWQELSILTLILVPGQHAPVPAAIVQKEQLGLISWNPETMEHEIKRRLPLRIPKCMFSEIRRYLVEPADLESPADGEVPTKDERDPFDEKLDREQIAIMRLALEKSQREEREADEMLVVVAPSDPTDPAVVAQVRKTRESGASFRDIAETTGLKLKDVMEICR